MVSINTIVQWTTRNTSGLIANVNWITIQIRDTPPMSSMRGSKTTIVEVVGALKESARGLNQL